MDIFREKGTKQYSGLVDMIKFKVENAKIINSHTNNAPLIIHVPGWRVYRGVLTRLFKIQESLG